MSHGHFSSTSSHSGENPCAEELKNSQSPKHGRDGSADADTKQISSKSIKPTNTVRQRVTKEVGSTSTTFIGPACRPETITVKHDIEDTLSMFYRELENIDSSDSTHASPEGDAGVGQSCKHLRRSTRKEMLDTSLENNHNMTRPSGTNADQKSIGQKHPSWSHWYQNEPYHPRSQRSSMDLTSAGAAPTQNQWRHLPPLKRPPHPRFHRPLNCRPPPPSSFPRPRGPLPHMNHNWSGSGMTNQYQELQEESHFGPDYRFPPPNKCSPLSQDFDGHAPHHFDRNRWGSDFDSESNNVNVGWSRNAEEGWSQPDIDSAWNQRFKTENEPHEQEDQCQPPDKMYGYDSSLALILMRGLPGSGKSTVAKELLSTGPNGLILSTDDYFSHKNGYLYDPSLLGVAHEWNQSRAKEAMHEGHSPVIIDNTNIQAWEMKPYVKMALERGYRIYFHEPDTSWKFDPFELEKRNKHGVPQEKIAQMLDRFSFPISIDVVMSCPDPPHVNLRHQPQHQHQRSNNQQYFH